MNQQNHHDYYRTRATTSRTLAQRAADPDIAAIHAELANRYEAMAAQMEQQEGNRDGAQAV